MQKDLVWAGLFLLLGIWLGLDTIAGWRRHDLDTMMPRRRLIGIMGSSLLILIGVLYALDSMGVLR